MVTNPIRAGPTPHRQRKEVAQARRRRKAEKRARKARPLTLSDRDRLRNKVIGVTCSEPWTDYCVEGAACFGVDPVSTHVPRQLDDLGIYPIDGMKPCCCSSCRGKRYWPPSYIGAGGVSYECYVERLPRDAAAKLPSTCSKIDWARMKKAAKYGFRYDGGL